jgi:hypothetical protein
MPARGNPDRLIDGLATTTIGVLMIVGASTTQAPWWEALQRIHVLPLLGGALLLTGGVIIVCGVVGLAWSWAVKAATVQVALTSLMLAAWVWAWAAGHGWEGSITATLMTTLAARLLWTAGPFLP